jgi:FkbM family methyltransferase
MSKIFNRILSEFNICPILVDVGAAGMPPRIWGPIAARSIYVGFDPDTRELNSHPAKSYFKSIIASEAIVDRPTSDVTLYLTQSPPCSSTLRPNEEALGCYLFCNLFTVTGEMRVPATTLNDVITRLGLQQIDWLKLDTQGTDLRIFQSLSDQIRSRVLALDVEPGLINAYIGEDTFVDVHAQLTRGGFWLSNLTVLGTPRMRRTNAESLVAHNPDLTPDLLVRLLKHSPAWCEARYLRTTEWLLEAGLGKREHLLLWLFSLLDNQIGFAIDVGVQYESIFGADKASRIMKEVPVGIAKHHRHRILLAKFILSIPRRVKRALQKLR